MCYFIEINSVTRFVYEIFFCHFNIFANKCSFLIDLEFFACNLCGPGVTLSRTNTKEKPTHVFALYSINQLRKLRNEVGSLDSLFNVVLRVWVPLNQHSEVLMKSQVCPATHKLENLNGNLRPICMLCKKKCSKK